MGRLLRAFYLIMSSTGADPQLGPREPSPGLWGTELLPLFHFLESACGLFLLLGCQKEAS